MTLYITKDGRQLGPYALAEAQSLVAAGTLQTTDWAWYEGLTTWIPLNQVPGFAAAAAPVPRAERPVMVWIICLFYFVCTPFSLLSLALIPLMLSGAFPISDAQRTYFESQNYIDYTLSGLTILANLAGAIFLFMLRRPALYFFGGTFILGIFNIIYQSIFKNWLGAIGNSPAGMVGAAIGAVIGFGITIAIILYVWHLFRKGVLR